MMKMTIRGAKEADIPGIAKLLNQVLKLHHNGRPDLFRGNTRKYTDEQLREIIADPKRPIFVAAVISEVFCMILSSISQGKRECITSPSMSGAVMVFKPMLASGLKTIWPAQT